MDDSRNQGWQSDRHREVPHEDEINLLDYLRVIYKHRRMIVLLCTFTAVTTAIVSLLLPEMYSATASVVPPIGLLQRESELSGALGDGLGAGKSALLRKAMDLTSVADMYAGILRSRAILDTIIDRFDLTKVYPRTKYRSKVRDKLRDNTTVRVSDEGIVSITVEDRKPARAAAMANAYVEELDRQNKRLSSGQATSKRVFLENRLKEIEQELSNIENIPARDAKIKEMLYQLLSQEYELAKIEEAKSMPTIQVLDAAVVPEVKSKPKRMLMVVLSGIVALLASVLLAFVREYVARIKHAQEREQLEFAAESAQQTDADADFDQVESRREIVATSRRKRAPQRESYSQEV